MDLVAVVGVIGTVLGMVWGIDRMIGGRINKSERDTNRRFDEAKQDNKEAHNAIGENIKAVNQKVDADNRSINTRLDTIGRDLAFLAGRRQGEQDARAAGKEGD